MENVLLYKEVPDKKNRKEMLLNKIIPEYDSSNIDWEIVKAKIEEIEKVPVIHMDEILYEGNDAKVVYYL